MKKIGPKNAMYPSLTTIVGTVINGKPNFMAIAHVGIMNHGTPQYISIGVNKAHYSNKGISENRTFSVNIPSREMVAETDYVGIVSGTKTDKSAVFDVFYGETETAPLIKTCPIVMECKLHRTLDLGVHNIYLGEIVETHVNESIITDGKIDIKKVDPLLFEMYGRQYFSIGESVAKAWSVGKDLNGKQGAGL